VVEGGDDDKDDLLNNFFDDVEEATTKKPPNLPLPSKSPTRIRIKHKIEKEYYRERDMKKNYDG